MTDQPIDTPQEIDDLPGEAPDDTPPAEAPDEGDPQIAADDAGEDVEDSEEAA
jgi:hypothetical protein